MNNLSRQRGITTIGMALIIALVAFFALLILRLAPMYIEYFKVVSAMDSLAQEEDLSSRGQPEIWKLLSRRMEIDDVHSVTKDDVDISFEGKQATVEVTYEVRAPIAGNIEVIGTFNKKVTLK